MNAVYTELDTPFTTADTVGPVSISYSGGKLTVKFANFRTPIQTIVFRDTRAFSWTGWDDAPEAIPDRVYQVANSGFLAPWERFSVGGEPFLHFKLGFNAEGKFLDVVATKMEYEVPDQPSHASFPSPSVWSRETVEQALAADNPEALFSAVIAVSMHESDRKYAQDLCVRLSDHLHPTVRGNAILGFGHIARTHGRLDENLVFPIVDRALKDKDQYIRQQAEAAKDDLGFFLKWKFEELNPPATTA